MASTSPARWPPVASITAGPSLVALSATSSSGSWPNSAHGTLDAVLNKARFWQHWAGTPLNERQVKVLNRALDGLEGKLTSSKWASLAKCSPDTALRDITQLLDLGVLTRAAGGGRSTSYELVRR